jgi:hypothetical protein
MSEMKDAYDELVKAIANLPAFQAGQRAELQSPVKDIEDAAHRLAKLLGDEA